MSPGISAWDQRFQFTESDPAFSWDSPHPTMLRLLCLLSIVAPLDAFLLARGPVRPAGAVGLSRATAPRCCEAEAPSDVDEALPEAEPEAVDAPSDVDDEPVGSVEPVDGPVGMDDASFAEAQRLKLELLQLGAACNRGEAATAADRQKMRTLFASLEQLNPTPNPTLDERCRGTWELVLSDTQLFRSSPFFMAGRAVCKDGEEAARCDAHRDAHARTHEQHARTRVHALPRARAFDTSGSLQV